MTFLIYCFALLPIITLIEEMDIDNPTEEHKEQHQQPRHTRTVYRQLKQSSLCISDLS